MGTELDKDKIVNIEDLFYYIAKHNIEEVTIKNGKTRVCIKRSSNSVEPSVITDRDDEDNKLLSGTEKE